MHVNASDEKKIIWQTGSKHSVNNNERVINFVLCHSLVLPQVYLSHTNEASMQNYLFVVESPWFTLVNFSVKVRDISWGFSWIHLTSFFLPSKAILLIFKLTFLIWPEKANWYNHNVEQEHHVQLSTWVCWNLKNFTSRQWRRQHWCNSNQPFT